MAVATISERVPVGGLEAYVARPVDAQPSAGMLLLPMVTGIGPQVRAFADDVAASGVTALTWDPWHGHSDEDLPSEELYARMGALDDADVRAEQTQLLDHMHGDLGLARVGVMGWCMGGRYALLLAAHDDRLVNCVAYHPTILAEPAPNHTEDAIAASARIAAPVKLVYPGADHLVPRSVFDGLTAALTSRDAASSISIFPGAEHGFMAAARQHQDVNRVATAISWPETLAFIAATTGLS
jgi:carboxymethylenebutenolidase